MFGANTRNAAGKNLAAIGNKTAHKRYVLVINNSLAIRAKSANFSRPHIAKTVGPRPPHGGGSPATGGIRLTAASRTAGGPSFNRIF